MRSLVALGVVVLGLLAGIAWSFGGLTGDSSTRLLGRGNGSRMISTDSAAAQRRPDVPSNDVAMKPFESHYDGDGTSGSPQVPGPRSDQLPSRTPTEAADLIPDDVNKATEKSSEDPFRTWRQREAMNRAIRDLLDDSDKALEIYVGWMWDKAVATFGWPDYAEPGEWYYQGWNGDRGLNFHFEGGAIKGLATLSADWKIPPPHDYP